MRAILGIMTGAPHGQTEQARMDVNLHKIPEEMSPYGGLGPTETRREHQDPVELKLKMVVSHHMRGAED